MMVTKGGTDTLRKVLVSVKDDETSQRDQIEKGVEEFTRYLRRTRGLSEARNWRRNMDRLIRTKPYDDIRRHLEWSLNTYFDSVQQDLERMFE
jgi:hypothetical protein